MTDATATCIYCGETKQRALFNREHVIPQSFGTFPDNMVLRDIVCKGCNDHFSRELELSLGRDSAEGIERFRNNLVSSRKIRVIGQRMKVRHDGGALDGAILEWEVASDGTALKVRPVPQLGFSKSPIGPFEWHRVSELPSGDTLRDRGFKPDCTFIMSGGLSSEEAAHHARGLGYNLATPPSECDPGVGPDGKVPFKIDGTIDRILLRAVAKIAFNYFAFHYPSIASMAQFDAIRRYVRYGEVPPVSPITISKDSILGGVPEDRQILVHIVTVAWYRVERRVVAQVSLFSWVQYRVVLTAEPFAISPLCVDSGHVFDPINRQILRLSRWISPGDAALIPMIKKST